MVMGHIGTLILQAIELILKSFKLKGLKWNMIKYVYPFLPHDLIMVSLVSLSTLISELTTIFYLKYYIINLPLI
jgi:hypothetical protein